MPIFSLHQVQCIPAPLDKVWSFFTNPNNLPKITSPDMRFTVLSPGGRSPNDRSSSDGDHVYAGQMIQYKLRPLPWLKVRWLTEITHVNEKTYFVDEQRYGPYRLWHHQHHFKEIAGGVEMTDLVHYRVPFGVLADTLIVRRQLEGIFRYRTQQVEAIFGAFPDPRSTPVSG